MESKIVSKEILKKINPFLWEISQGYFPNMNVPARIFTSESMLTDILQDRSIEQLINITTLNGIKKAAYAMPDIHEGYGFPIGGVAATQFPDGVISPGGIGYDINCGVRLLKSDFTFDQIKNQLDSLARELYHWIPSGVGRSGTLKLSKKELNNVLKNGIKWMIEKEYATISDMHHIESNGILENADPSVISDLAKERGADQLGTIGSGNHFVEVDFVEEIYDNQIAQAFGIFKNQVTILIHTGSRGLGHQVATDYIKIMMNVMPKYKITLPDRELACVPFNSQEGQNYFNAMCAAANFAWANRQIITHLVRQAWKREFNQKEDNLSLLYDVAHNIAKIERHKINNKEETLIVHRKGATRAFPPNHPDLSAEFQITGQPVLIPGSMGTASYILAGTAEGMNLSFGSTCHGAGRRMSRSAAKKIIHGRKLRDKLKKEGISIQAGSLSGLAEEAPEAYKNINEVVEIVHLAGIAKKVAKLHPCAVIKG